MAEIISKIKKYAKSASDSAKKYAEIAKIKLNIKMEESNLEECLCELGKAYYLFERHSLENQDEIESLLVKADLIGEKIKGYNRSLADLEEKEVCEHCSTVKDCDSPCEACGEKIVAEKPTDEEEPTDKENPKEE